MKRIITTLSIVLIQLMVVSFASAEEKEVKDCFEKNRATLHSTWDLDKVF